MGNRTSEAFKAWWAEQSSCDYDEMIIAEKAWEAARAIPDDSVVPSLDERMKAAGMMTIDQMVNTDTNPLLLHAGIDTPEKFMHLLEMKRREYSSMFAEMELKDNPEGEEMYEWVLAHHAIYSAIHGQYKAMIAAQEQSDG